MKNLLLLAQGGLGERESPNAPTFWNTVECFIARGWRVWVADCGSNADTPIGERDYGDGLYILRFNPPFLKMTKIRYLGVLFRLFNGAYTRIRLKKEARKLIRERSLTADDTVVYSLDAYATKAARDISRAYGMPFVSRFYGIWDMMKYPDTWLNTIHHYPCPGAYKVPADIFLMTNDGTRGDEMFDRCRNRSKKFLFWRNGVDKPGELPAERKACLPSEVKDDDVVLMTLSRLDPGKRIDRAIRAMADVVPRHPEAKLVICGYGKAESGLRQLAEELGIAGNVLFTGRIPHDKAYHYLASADIFLSFYEESNLGNPLFEAMRVGRPIITLDVGATNTVVTNGENGILLPPDRPELIVESICRLLDDPAERIRLGDGALRYANENFWTWDERVNAEVDELEKLLPNAGSED